MKHLLLVSCLALCLKTHAQTDTITIRKHWTGTTYRKGDNRLTPKQVENIVSTDDKAFRAYRKSKAPEALGFAFAFAGGALIGYDLGQAVTSGEVHPAILGAGVGLICVSFPFYSWSLGHVRKSVEIYNGRQKATVLNERECHMSLFASSNTMGLKLTF